jgi:hypothetical protein
MEALTAMVINEESEGIISYMPGFSPLQRLLIYADDVVLIRPTSLDFAFVREALPIFGMASGLCINYVKSSTILIR